jgi:DNA replication protein DnaC
MPAETERCAYCDNYGYERRWIPYRNPTVKDCRCRVASRKAARIAAANIPVKYAHATFDSFRAYNANLVEARRVAQFWAESYPLLPQRADDTTGRGLVLSGAAGVGKTHLAAVLLREAIARTGCWGLFSTTKDLLWKIRQSYNATKQATEADILQPVMRCDLLVLDDLGEERVTDWVAETMNLIVNTRYNEQRPIVCTTNYADIDDPTEVNGLECRIGFRMRSRLHEMCEFVEMEGASYRDLPPNGTDQDLRRLAKTTRKHAPVRAQHRRAPGAQDGAGDLKWPGGKGGNT